MSEFLEIVMILSFGASWPFNVVKSYRARTAKGKSPVFLALILIGYVAGIAAKLMSQSYMAEFDRKWYVLCFYCLNLLMVGTNVVIHLRNMRLDKLRGEEGK